MALPKKNNTRQLGFDVYQPVFKDGVIVVQGKLVIDVMVVSCVNGKCY